MVMLLLLGLGQAQQQQQRQRRQQPPAPAAPLARRVFVDGASTLFTVDERYLSWSFLPSEPDVSLAYGSAPLHQVQPVPCLSTFY